MPPVAIVTGSATGLGAACVQRFVEGGWQVGALDRHEQEERRGVVPVRTDITDPAAVQAAIETVVERAGRPRACLNIAGAYPRSTVQTFAVADYRAIFDVNVLGTLLVSQAFVHHRAKDEPCSILNIASQDGYTPANKQVLYSASKAAVINLTASMAQELAAEGVRVNALAPADIATERLRHLRGGELTGQEADPDQVAEVCFVVAGQQALPLVHGQTIKVEASDLDRSWSRG